MAKNGNPDTGAGTDPVESEAGQIPESAFIDHEARALHVMLAKLIDKQRGGLMPQLNRLARDYTDAVRAVCPPDEPNNDTEEKTNG